ncbi:MAG: DUF1735 domain-containing protein [Bacteroidales bacterium]|nr:DUF1735 domain-containing protein [Bacteroidales bacterium]
MKKILAFLILSVVMVSCYDDYIKDYDYDAIYFPYQIDVRTFVVGEGMNIEIGAALGGVMENTEDRIVDFVLDNSLITPERLTAMKTGATYIKESVAAVTTLLPLPANYYTLSNSNSMLIKAGQHMGSVVLKADSSAFLSDVATINATYAIPLYITRADADSIIERKRFAVIGLKYENMLFGNYYHGGVTIEKDASGTAIDTVLYYTTIPQVQAKTWALKTIAPNALVVKGYSSNSSAKDEMVLTLNGNDISVSSATGSTFTYLPEGASTFNRAKLLQDRKIYLSYKYVNAAGNTCYAQDTLTFRNRIRDGVNEWQDENPSHYTK